MGPKELAKIERLNWIFAAILIAGAAILFETRVVTGVAIGALVACLNFSGVRRLVAASMSPRRQGAGRGDPAAPAHRQDGPAVPRRGRAGDALPPA